MKPIIFFLSRAFSSLSFLCEHKLYWHTVIKLRRFMDHYSIGHVLRCMSALLFALVTCVVLCFAMPMDIACMPGFSTSALPLRNSCCQIAAIAFLFHIKVYWLEAGARAVLNMFTLGALEVVRNPFTNVSIFPFSKCACPGVIEHLGC